MSTIETGSVALGGWTADQTHSTVGFRVLYMGVVPFEGTFRELTATLDEDGLRGVAAAASVDVDNEALAEHLASPDFFDSAVYPEVRFESGPLQVDAGEVTVEGVLEIKGNRAPIVLTGAITEPVTDPYGNTKRGLTLAGTVDRTRLGLTWNAPLPEGGSMLADDVELEASLLLVEEAR